MNTKNKVLLSSLISMAVLSLTACGGGDSTDPIAQHPDPDFFSPNITLNGGDVVIEEGTIYIDEGATASDNVDGDNVNVTTSGFVNADTAGTYTLTYSATDVAGNSAEETRTIKVIRGETFDKFAGKWEVVCKKTTNPNLTSIGVDYTHEAMTISGRNVKYRIRGFGQDNSSCTGAPALKGTALGRVVYTGKVLSGTYTGEKVDVTLDEAHFSGANNKIVEVDLNAEDENGLTYAEKMMMPEYDILALTGDGKLVRGDISTQKGESNDTRPDTFDNQDPYYKVD